MAFIEPSTRHPMTSHPRVTTVAGPMCLTVEQAVVEAVVYSDIFDYPLTTSEIHRYLVGVALSREALDNLLQTGQLVSRYLSQRDGYFTLPGREAIVETRRQRERQAALLWPRALRYGRIIASLPFVRGVAITGELAMDNVGTDSDIDYFIVTAPGRLWLCRLMIVGVVRYAAPRGDVVCPNFLLSEDALALHNRDLYTAHEVAQMVPIYGHETYWRIRELNSWVDGILPNAGGPPRSVAVSSRGRRARRLVETALRSRIGARLERWEMDRKVRKFTQGVGTHSEASFSPDWCKGHVDGHGERILSRFTERWQAVERPMP